MCASPPLNHATWTLANFSLTALTAFHRNIFVTEQTEPVGFKELYDFILLLQTQLIRFCPSTISSWFEAAHTSNDQM